MNPTIKKFSKLFVIVAIFTFIVFVYYFFFYSTNVITNSDAFVKLKSTIEKDSSLNGSDKITSIETTGNACVNEIDKPNRAIFDIVIQHKSGKENYIRFFLIKNDSTWSVVKLEDNPGHFPIQGCNQPF